MSFKFVQKKKDRIASRFLAQVHAVFANAAVEAKKETGLNQRQIAEELGVDKSSISRILSGAGNPTARTIGELASALGYVPELVLKKNVLPEKSNHRVINNAGNSVMVTVASSGWHNNQSRDSKVQSVKAKLPTSTEEIQL